MGKKRNKSRTESGGGKSGGGSAAKKGGLRGRRRTLAACAAIVVVAVGVALAVFQLWDMGGNDDGAGESSEWAGQEQGYVGPDGEGVLDPDDYESDEDYESALIGEGGVQADVPRVEVSYNEEGTVGYYEGIMSVSFYCEYGEERAREIIAEEGGVWVSDVFAWSGAVADGKADAEVYFPDAPSAEEMNEVIADLVEYPEVASAYIAEWFEGLD